MYPIQSLMNDTHTLLPSACMYEDTTHVQMHAYIHTHTPLLISSNLQLRIPSGLYRSGFPTNTIPVVLSQTSFGSHTLGNNAGNSHIFI